MTIVSPPPFHLMLIVGSLPLRHANAPTPACRRQHPNIAAHSPATPPTHYPQHPANVDEREPSNASEASAAAPPTSPWAASEVS